MNTSLKKFIKTNSKILVNNRSLIKPKNYSKIKQISKKNHQEFLVDYYQHTIPITIRYLNAIQEYKKKY